MIPLYSLALFLPTLINELGYRAIDAQLFTVPPYALACVCTLVSAYLSDRLNLRGPFIIITALLGIVGFIILLCSNSSTLGYVAMFFATSGVFSADAVFCTWFSTAYGGETKRGLYFAFLFRLALRDQHSGSNCNNQWSWQPGGVSNDIQNFNFSKLVCSILASFVYISPRNYYIGYIVNIGCLVATSVHNFSSVSCCCLGLIARILLTAFMMWQFKRENHLKEQECAGKDITVELKAEWKNMGDRSPLFRYADTCSAG